MRFQETRIKVKHNKVMSAQFFKLFLTSIIFLKTIKLRKIIFEHSTFLNI